MVQSKDQKYARALTAYSRCLPVFRPSHIPSLSPRAVKDARMHKSCTTISHGPYLDDWSKVPAEIAEKYNTSPTYKGK